MGRHKKKGLDYFPLDVDLDDAEDYLEAKFGIEGFGILVKLWSRIYKKHGYYCNWDDRAKFLFSKNINVDSVLVNRIVNFCLDNNIFNQGLFNKYEILTSSGIQSRYVRICTQAKRLEINIDPDYNLHPLYAFNPVDTPKSPGVKTKTSRKTPGESTQSKIKEKKLNNKNTSADNSENNYREIVKLFYREKYQDLPKYIRKIVDDPKKREAYFDKGIPILDTLIRLDGYSLKEIKATLLFAIRDEFWSGNLYAISGRLRKRDSDGLHKFDKIYQKFKDGNGVKSDHYKKEERLRRPIQNGRSGSGFQKIKSIITENLED